jgi:hypothetical protein
VYADIRFYSPGLIVRVTPKATPWLRGTEMTRWAKDGRPTPLLPTGGQNGMASSSCVGVRLPPIREE